MSATYEGYEILLVNHEGKGVLHVQINRPKKLNAMNKKFWVELRECFQKIGKDREVRVVVISAAGRYFTSGLDVQDHAGQFGTQEGDVARVSYAQKEFLEAYQSTFLAIDKIPQPVIAAVHSGCIGGGVDMICACDIRLCSADAWFSIKEVDLGLAADMGTLDRLPKIVGNQSLVRELAYTARKMDSSEALKCGFVSHVFKDKEELLREALAMATIIAAKSPVAIVGTKTFLNYARDHSVDESLRHTAMWNMAMLQTKDIAETFSATVEQRVPIFSNL